MPSSKRLRVLVALDGSPASDATVETVLGFPWPDSTRVGGVVAVDTTPFRLQSRTLHDALRSALEHEVGSARDALASRWRDAEVVVMDGKPVETVLAQARRAHADVIALGWRGHGSFRRLLAGSVSRGVAARAESSVLVVRTAPQRVKRFVVGFDGGPNSRRAVKLLGRLAPGRDHQAVLVRIIEPADPFPGRAARLPAAVRATIRNRIAELEAERRAEAAAALETAAAQLEAMGWNTATELLNGSSLAALLTASRVHRADVLVVGARETTGVRRALLGSVAEGVLNHSRTPVLIVR
jgi:nucleotide-binding universal stress UspA family protein